MTCVALPGPEFKGQEPECSAFPGVAVGFSWHKCSSGGASPTPTPRWFQFSWKGNNPKKEGRFPEWTYWKFNGFFIGCSPWLLGQGELTHV